MEGKEFRELCGGLIQIKDENDKDEGGKGRLKEEIGNKA